VTRTTGTGVPAISVRPRCAGTEGATPYTLRHSFASLLVQAGWNALEISSEMGNSPEVVQRDYSHLFREFARG
jgi:integrase